MKALAVNFTPVKKISYSLYNWFWAKSLKIVIMGVGKCYFFNAAPHPLLMNHFFECNQIDIISSSC